MMNSAPEHRVYDNDQVPPLASASTPPFQSLLTPHSTPDSYSSTLSSFILNALKYETLARLSAPISRSRFVNSGLEGFESSELLVKTKCDLSSFISIVHFFRKHPTSRLPNAFRLNPNSNSFQHPSRATQLLSIDFENLRQLLLALDIRDTSDHSRARLKTTSKKGCAMLRLLGSACVLSVPSQNAHDSALDIDCILPGLSHTPFVSDQLVSALRTIISEGDNMTGFTDANDSQNCYIFYRIRRNYDQSQGRYLSPWRISTVNFRTFVSSSTSGSSENNNSNSGPDSDTTFSVQWTQSAPLSATAWTSDARYFGEHVLGELSIFFPSVTFFGDSTIREIDGLLDGVR